MREVEIKDNKGDSSKGDSSKGDSYEFSCLA